jgi:enoyl-CoA hydratase
VNRVVSRDTLADTTYEMAAKIARQPRMGLALTKQVINHIEDLQGKRTGMEAAFAWHHFAHVHNDQISGDLLGGYDAKGMVRANKAEANGNGESA